MFLCVYLCEFICIMCVQEPVEGVGFLALELQVIVGPGNPVFPSLQ